MNDTDKIKLVMGALLEEKLAPIRSDIESIKVKLGNHVEHLTAKLNSIENNFTGQNKDIEWIKKLFDPEQIATREASMKADVGWIKWIVRLMVATAIGTIANAAALVWHLFLGK